MNDGTPFNVDVEDEEGGGGGGGGDGDFGGGGADDDAPLGSFVLRSDSTKLVATLAGAIYSMRKDQYCIITANSVGVRIAVETPAKHMHAAAYIPAEHFRVYELPLVRGEGTEVRLKVQMSTLLECLNVFDAAAGVASLCATFSESDRVLKILMEQASVACECDLLTLDVQQTADYEVGFRKHPLIGKSLVVSDVLHEMLRQVCETEGASTIVFSMDKRDPALRFHTYSGVGTTTMEVSGTSDSFLSHDVVRAAEFSYDIRVIGLGMRSIACAKQTFIRLNEAGMLSLANKVETDVGTHAIITCIFMPDVSLEGGDGAGAGGAGGAEGGGAGAEAAGDEGGGRASTDRGGGAMEGEEGEAGGGGEAEY